MESIVNIGILHSQKIHFQLNENYYFKEGNKKIAGILDVQFYKGEIKISGFEKTFSEITLIPEIYKTATAEIFDVVIGINFHWQQKQNQRFRGKLIFKTEDEKVWVINHIPVEEYLKSVISSEMKATSDLELLKAHAVISRSWLLAQIERRLKGKQKTKTEFIVSNAENELIKWYDNHDHKLFDVCADDHCQRYQGVTQISTLKSIDAVASTYGEVLMYAGELCDARFSKSCGGVSENFEYAWENTHFPYLSKIIDNQTESEFAKADLKIEENAKNWILNAHAAFCNTKDKQVLEQILNDYDLDTEFYRWTVVLKQENLSALILKKSGINFGEILSLTPIERGESGRIVKLEIKGNKKTLTIGKELEIRRILSESHLFSSAFMVEEGEKINNIPQSFTLKGAGWGHGVGLCQIGAAVMANNGYNYLQILKHYFNGAEIVKKYEK